MAVSDTTARRPVRNPSRYTDLAAEVRESGLLGRRYAWYWSRIAMAVRAFAAVWLGLFSAGQLLVPADPRRRRSGCCAPSSASSATMPRTARSSAPRRGTTGPSRVLAGSSPG